MTIWPWSAFDRLAERERQINLQLTETQVKLAAREAELAALRPELERERDERKKAVDAMLRNAGVGSMYNETLFSTDPLPTRHNIQTFVADAEKQNQKQYRDETKRNLYEIAHEGQEEAV